MVEVTHCQTWGYVVVAVIASGLLVPGSYGAGDCRGRMAQYGVVLKTFWTKQRFPKHYPEWSPEASWSNMIGESTLYIQQPFFENK